MSILRSTLPDLTLNIDERRELFPTDILASDGQSALLVALGRVIICNVR